MKREPPLEAPSAEMLDAIKANAEHFPSYIQSRGRSYLSDGRVGPPEVEPNQIRATVRGSRNYRTQWLWDGHTADPHCTCPAGPICKHAYALAEAIDGTRHHRVPVAELRARARGDRSADVRHPPGRDGEPQGVEPLPERVRAEMTSDLAQWARRHVEAPARVVRAVFGKIGRAHV